MEVRYLTKYMYLMQQTSTALAAPKWALAYTNPHPAVPLWLAKHFISVPYLSSAYRESSPREGNCSPVLRLVKHPV